MMNRAEAMAYGMMIGCRYYVYNENGGLLGGCTTLEAAEKMRAEFEREYKTNPWNKGMKVYIKEEK